MRFLLNLVITAFAILIAAYVVPGITVDGFFTALIVALVLAIVNATLWFFLRLITFPLNLLSLGLISLIIGGLMVVIVGNIVEWFIVDNIRAALVFAVIVALIQMIIGVDRKAVNS